MYRAVFFDIDGTLISKKDLSIPNSLKETLRLLKANGIYIGIATGRHTFEIESENLLQDLEFDFYVTLNGQLCFENNQLVYQQAIAKEDVETLLDISDKHQIPLLLIEQNDMYLNMCNDDVIMAQASIHTLVPPIKKVDCNHQFYQICAYLKPEDLHLFQNLQHTTITQWHSAAYDLISDQGCKTEGIEAVLKPYGISLDEVICFGDGDNDADMLSQCGLGIAMGVASEKARAAANESCDTVENNGIYKALKKHHMI